MLLTFYNVYFGKDGNIYFNKENRNEFIKESDFKKQFLGFTSNEEEKNFKFWISLLNNRVFFEEGLTVTGVWECLRESASFWSSLLGIDVLSYLDELSLPKGESVYPDKYEAIVAYNLPSLNLEAYNGNNLYHIRMHYDIKGYNKEYGILFKDNISKIPLNNIKNLPFFFERIDGVFLQEDIKGKIEWEKDSLANYYKETKVNEAVYAIFGHCFRSPAGRDNLFNAKANLALIEQQRNHYSNSVKSLSGDGVDLIKDIKPMELPEGLSRACSTILPYALKRCK